jgi:dTDP-glucose 4,6-dehydratase
MELLLITGGCGFIGSNFIRHLLEHEPAVSIVNFDSLSYAGNLANLSDVERHPRYSLIRGDITERDQVRQAVARGITGIINFAAESHVDRSIHDATPFVRTNVLGTQILLDAAREHGVTRFLQVSTDEVYGSLGPTGYFREDTPLCPNSPYSASKAGADMLVASAFHTFGLATLITRCSNNYGPYQFPEKLIPLFITNLLRDQSVPVYGDGMNVRDWIHVRDHCRALGAVWKKGRPGEVYNIGGHSERTNLQLTQQLLEVMGKPSTLIRYVKDRLGHDRRYAIDCSKIEGELGWKPEIRFEDGLRETVRWYAENPDWIAGVCSGAYREYYKKQYG